LNLLEVFLGLMVPGVLVGMVFHRQLAVGLLDIFLIGVSGDTEDLVVVFVIHLSPVASL
jgi:hypothetical protein